MTSSSEADPQLFQRSLYPNGILTQIQYTPHNDIAVSIDLVINGIGETLREEAMIAKHLGVNSGIESKGINVGS